MLPVACVVVAGFSSSGVATSHVLPVLWIVVFSHNGPVARPVYTPKHAVIEHDEHDCMTAEIPTKFCLTMKAESTVCEIRTGA